MSKFRNTCKKWFDLTKPIKPISSHDSTHVLRLGELLLEMVSIRTQGLNLSEPSGEAARSNAPSLAHTVHFFCFPERLSDGLAITAFPVQFLERRQSCLVEWSRSLDPCRSLSLYISREISHRTNSKTYKAIVRFTNYYGCQTSPLRERLEVFLHDSLQRDRDRRVQLLDSS